MQVWHIYYIMHRHWKQGKGAPFFKKYILAPPPDFILQDWVVSVLIENSKMHVMIRFGVSLSFSSDMNHDCCTNCSPSNSSTLCHTVTNMELTTDCTDNTYCKYPFYHFYLYYCIRCNIGGDFNLAVWQIIWRSLS